MFLSCFFPDDSTLRGRAEVLVCNLGAQTKKPGVQPSIGTTRAWRLKSGDINLIHNDVGYHITKNNTVEANI